MKVSLNSIRTVNAIYGSADDPAPHGLDDLVRKVGAQLAGIDEVIKYGERFEGVVVARVISCEDHSQADRLHVCKLDDGGKVTGVERDEHGHVQVVCGAPNVREGLTVAWLPPGTTVPSSLGGEPFVLEARPLRGVISNGMLASPKELTIGDNHDGIMELDTDATPGTSFIEAYDLGGDAVIDMENKMFTHRPDCFGQLGIARELAGIQHQPYKSPDWYVLNPDFPAVESEPLPLIVKNELPELVSRFTAVTMRDVTVRPSPVWLQIFLSKIGIRPINNIVDYTNFFMHETGQPIHAYDYDKVVAQDSGASEATITARHPHEGEKIVLLNGKEITPRPEAIMIATRDKLIGIGGVMGGADTEVDAATKRIIIEVANFDMYSIRRTAMEHGIFTDAVTRFNKGQSPLQNRAVLAKIVDEIRRYADGKVTSDLIDVNHLSEEVNARGTVHAPVKLDADFINARLGVSLTAETMAGLLRNVEFDIDVEGSALTVQAPFWRTDIVIAEDVVEEVGRLYGYDQLPLQLPMRDLTPAKHNPTLNFKARIRSALAAAGANELLTYSFVHADLLRKAGQNPAQAYQLSNALSPDLQYYRLSLTPSLLEKVSINVKAGYEQCVLFEIGKTHVLGKVDEDGLPIEFERVAAVFTAVDKTAQAYDGAAYYQARHYLIYLFKALGLNDVTFTPLESADADTSAAYYEPGRAATVRIGDSIVGRIGEYKASVRKAFKLPGFCAGFELGLTPLLRAQQGLTAAYRPQPKFPKVEQDICLRVAAATSYGQVFAFVEHVLGEHAPEHVLASLSPIDIYQRPDDTAYKQITLRYSIASYERTLTTDEVNTLLDGAAEAAAESLDAIRV